MRQHILVPRSTLQRNTAEPNAHVRLKVREMIHRVGENRKGPGRAGSFASPAQGAARATLDADMAPGLECHHVDAPEGVLQQPGHYPTFIRERSMRHNLAPKFGHAARSLQPSGPGSRIALQTSKRRGEHVQRPMARTVYP